MQSFYLLNWLSKNCVRSPELLDSLKFELDRRIYSFGEHFIAPFEASRFKRTTSNVKQALHCLSPLGIKRRATPGKNVRISSNAYFAFNAELENIGYEACEAPWTSSLAHPKNWKLLKLVLRTKSYLNCSCFKELISPEFEKLYFDLKAELKDYYVRENISALIVPYDLPFFERLAIKIFKELGRPSIIALHGLPGRYNNLDDNRTDFLFVWGESIKRLYVEAGIPSEKIFVTGHPLYQSYQAKKEKHPTLDNVVVLSKALCGAQHSTESIVSDRGNAIAYLYSIQRNLEYAGVQKAKLRLHPSESKSWYGEFLNLDFYEFDNEPLSSTLSNATLVIGPTSTVFLESLIHEVYYLSYEPVENGRDVTGLSIVPPFDGSFSDIVVARSELDLLKQLKQIHRLTRTTIHAFIQFPFDISFMNKQLSTYNNKQLITQ